MDLLGVGFTAKEILTIVISLFVPSVVAFIAVLRIKKDILKAASHENLKALISIYDDILNEESLLEVYGIAPKTLQDKDISIAQFVHLLKDFTAGQLYYDIKFEHKNGKFRKDNYRYYLCSQEITRKAWPYLKCFFDTTKYGDCIERTINEIHEINIEEKKNPIETRSSKDGIPSH